jgi:hypothetical protein
MSLQIGGVDGQEIDLAAERIARVIGDLDRTGSKCAAKSFLQRSKVPQLFQS